MQGEYFHYEQGAATIAGDRLIKAQLAAQGVTLVFIDAEDVVDDVEYYVTGGVKLPGFKQRQLGGKDESEHSSTHGQE